MGHEEERPNDKKVQTIDGEVRDLGIMARLDEYLAPLQPQGSKEYRQKMLDEQFPNLDGPVATERVELTPEDATKMIMEKAFKLGADLVGFTELDSKLVVEKMETAGKWAVVVVVAMDYDAISTAPAERSGVEVTKAYYVLGDVLIKLASYIRSLGYMAYAHHPRSMYGRIGSILHKPTAYKAGIGEIGRNTLIITPEFGPRVRLATISTELEVVPDEPIDIGIAEYCYKCQRCLNKCPTGSIPRNKMAVSPTGDPNSVPEPLWRLDYDKCLPFFIKTDGCAVCIKVCSFNRKPDEAEDFVEKILKKKHKSRARRDQ